MPQVLVFMTSFFVTEINTELWNCENFSRRKAKDAIEPRRLQDIASQF